MIKSQWYENLETLLLHFYCNKPGLIWWPLDLQPNTLTTKGDHLIPWSAPGDHSWPKPGELTLYLLPYILVTWATCQLITLPNSNLLFYFTFSSSLKTELHYISTIQTTYPVRVGHVGLSSKPWLACRLIRRPSKSHLSRTRRK